MALLVYIIAIIIIALYISTYYKYPKNVQILQTRLNDFNYDMLLTKQPLVIETTNLDLSNLKKKWFLLNYTKSFNLDKSNDWSINKFKYILLQAQTDGEILIFPPSKKFTNNIPDPSENLIAIQLKYSQILILPLHWRFMPDIAVNALGVHDLVSYFLI